MISGPSTSSATTCRSTGCIARADLVLADLLGADAEDHVAVAPGGEGARVAGRQRQREAAAHDPQPAVALGLDPGVQQVHRRAREEAGDEGVGRIAVDLHRRADLDDAAVLHDADALAHGHRLDLVVGDVDDRAAEPAVQLDQLGAHDGCAAWHRGWTAARRAGRPPARGSAPGRAPRAGAGRRTARAACGPAARRCRAWPRSRAPWRRSRRGRGRGSACRRPDCRRPSYAGTARSSGTRWRGCGPSDRRRSGGARR